MRHSAPWPWEPSPNLGVLVAKLETVLWVGLYAMALAGLWAGRRNLEVVPYPVLSSLGVIAAAALTQGNLGTAFRHRGQVLWALAVLAAVGLESVIARARLRRPRTESANTAGGR